MNIASRACGVALLAALASPVYAGEAAAPAQSAPRKTEPAAPAPTQGDKAKKELDEAVVALRDYSVERREQALARARRSMQALDQRIESLQSETGAGWARTSKEMRTRSQQTMADLRMRRNRLAEWYGGMRHGSAGAWGEVRTGFVASYQDLTEAMRKAREQFDQARSEANRRDAAADRDARKADEPGEDHK